MLYIERNANGTIIALHNNPSQNAVAATSANDQEVALFLSQHAPENKLIQTDLKLVRVLEDLIELLIAKKLICLTDLPSAAQLKLLDRKKIRSSHASQSRLLIDEDELL